MTEVTDLSNAESTPVEPCRWRANLAIGLALASLTISALTLAQHYVPLLQRHGLGKATEVKAIDNGADFRQIQQQIGSLAEQIQKNQQVSGADDYSSRLDSFEQRLTAVNDALSQQSAQAQKGAMRPSAIAFTRVENKLLRGEPFAAELALLKQSVAEKMSPEQDRDLTAASSGVATTGDLLAALHSQERAARRASALAAASGPVERVLAELQSLVLVKSVNESPQQDDRFDALLLAIRHADKATTEAAWLTLPAQAKQVLYPIYGEVERRQRAEAAIQELAPTALVTE